LDATPCVQSGFLIDSPNRWENRTKLVWWDHKSQCQSSAKVCRVHWKKVL